MIHGRRPFRFFGSTNGDIVERAILRRLRRRSLDQGAIHYDDRLIGWAAEVLTTKQCFETDHYQMHGVFRNGPSDSRLMRDIDEFIGEI